MRQRGGGLFFTAQHAGDFEYPCIIFHGRDSAVRMLPVGVLGHHQMLVGAGGDLGQMGYRQHLAVRTQLLHQPPHRVRHRAADAGVDLVKYQGRRAAELAVS